MSANLLFWLILVFTAWLVVALWDNADRSQR